MAALLTVGPTATAVGCMACRLFSLALKSDGTVWGWGDNSAGQLGDGTTTQRLTPVQVVGLTGVVAIAAGYNSGLALKSNGTLWAWGDNSFGQLGDGTTTQRLTPVQVSGLSGVTAVAMGASHSLALKTDGSLWAWGNNAFGQLGDGTTTQRLTPVQVSGLSGVTAVSAGLYHSLAVTSGGVTARLVAAETFSEPPARRGRLRRTSWSCWWFCRSFGG
jgi:alpha-tubulin suppressor-like RCC1 family protein